MTNSDIDLLVEETKHFLKIHYKKNRHHVACVLVTANNKYFGLHLDTSGYDICAEPIAMSNALLACETDFRILTAVYWDGNELHEPTLVSPCGDCRQMLIEYAPNLEVVVEDGGNLKTVSIKKLLPYAYVNPKRHLN